MDTPQRRNWSFEPRIVTKAKGQRRFEGFDKANLSLYWLSGASVAGSQPIGAQGRWMFSFSSLSWGA